MSNQRKNCGGCWFLRDYGRSCELDFDEPRRERACQWHLATQNVYGDDGVTPIGTIPVPIWRKEDIEERYPDMSGAWPPEDRA